MSPLPRKVECPLCAFGVQMIQHRHQLFTFRPRCIFVEEVKPGNALAEKVTRHNAGLLISLTRLSDFVPTRRGGVYDVMVARWRPVLHMQTLTSSPPGFLTDITAPCKPGLAPSVTVLKELPVQRSGHFDCQLCKCARRKTLISILSPHENRGSRQALGVERDRHQIVLGQGGSGGKKRG